jgi:hypothetical protein
LWGQGRTTSRLSEPGGPSAVSTLICLRPFFWLDHPGGGSLNSDVILLIKTETPLINRFHSIIALAIVIDHYI